MTPKQALLDTMVRIIEEATLAQTLMVHMNDPQLQPAVETAIDRLELALQSLRNVIETL